MGPHIIICLELGLAMRMRIVSANIAMRMFFMRIAICVHKKNAWPTLPGTLICGLTCDQHLWTSNSQSTWSRDWRGGAASASAAQRKFAKIALIIRFVG